VLPTLSELRLVLRISGAHGILRRYFVVNGFDGALTMLGLLVGFHMGGATDLRVVIGACLGAAVALGISGVASAYISEAEERRRELADLEGAMVTDLRDSAHGRAARLVPTLTAAVNGLAPFCIGLLCLLPLWLAQRGLSLPLPPLLLAMGICATSLFLLGVFLGRVGGRSWLYGGLRTLAIAAITVLLIAWLSPG
jgi:predicted membrane protein (TIGR00267 family)